MYVRICICMYTVYVYVCICIQYMSIRYVCMYICMTVYVYRWYNNVVCLEDIPPNIGVLVGIAGSDQVSYAPALLEYTSKCRQQREDYSASTGTFTAPIQSVYWPDYSHGQLLVSGAAQVSLYKALVINEKHCTQ